MPIDAAAKDYDYKYMGKKESGNYIYYGFKVRGGSHWEIMRKDIMNIGNWQYCFGISGWSVAWADPTGLIYGDPPDA